MRRWVVLLILAMCSWFADAETSVRAEYHPPTNLFALMDETALLYPWSTDAYRETWTERFGWSRADRDMMQRYKRYRKRTVDISGQSNRSPEDGLFSTRTAALEDTDALAHHFITAASVDDALATLEAAAPADDAQMLRDFYAHFRPGWEVILEESKVFEDQAAVLNADLSGDQVDAFLGRMTAFYRVDGDLEFTLHFVWWPPIDRTIADLLGETFVLYRHPERHAGETDRAEIAMHEAAHYFSARQPAAQKSALTAEFLEICPIEADNLMHVIEEPLAVAWGQAAFAKYGKGAPLNPEQNWYRPPMPDVMGRLLWLHIDQFYETDATITDGLVTEAAGYCARILDAGETVRRKRSWWPF